MDVNELSWWVLFNVFLLGMLALDLGLFHRRAREVTVKEALGWSAVWIVLSILFGLGICFWIDHQRAMEFFAGYLIEKSLSVDNVFVFAILFSFFQVPRQYQHKVLFYGIVGALIMRGSFIFAGIELIRRFHWIIYVLGVFLVYTGIRAVRERPKEIRPKHHPVLRLFRRFMPITDEYEGGRFTVKKGGRRFATPLLVTLLMVETTDLIFAMDSIPAILAITVHPSVVYSSNAFAILGLRALYFALAGLILQVRYLKYGVCAILVYVGIKMLLHDVYKIPVAVSLGVIVGMIAVAVLASFAWPSAATPGAGRPERDIRLDVTQAQNDDQAGELGVLPRSTQECTQAGSGIKRMNESQRTVKNHGRKAD